MHKKINKMVKRMKERETASSKKRRKREKKNPGLIEGNWFVYILECADGSYYTGVTKSLMKRVETHNAGKGARYTKTRRPVRLRFAEFCESRADALVRECEIKSFSREKKEELMHAPDDPEVRRRRKSFEMRMIRRFRAEFGK